MTTWADSLVKDYRKSKSNITRLRTKLLRIESKNLTDRDADDILKLNEIVNSMVFAIEWMKTGHQPGTYRGVGKRGIYQEPRILDKDLFPSLYEPPVKTFRLTLEQREEALGAIRSMSPREFDCFLLHAVEGLSYAEIAEKLEISKRTVQQSIDRAKKKIPED